MNRIRNKVNIDIDTGDLYQYTPDKILDGIHQLLEAELVVGHNFILIDLYQEGG